MAFFFSESATGQLSLSGFIRLLNIVQPHPAYHQIPRVCDLGQEWQLRNQPSSSGSKIVFWHLVISEGRLEKSAAGHLALGPDASVGKVPSQSSREGKVTPLPCLTPVVTSGQTHWQWRVRVSIQEAGLALALGVMGCFGKFD